MKNKLSLAFFAFAIIALSAFTINKAVVRYEVDASKSSITWVGKKLTGSHNGTIALKSGNLLLDSKKLVGGSFVIDMTTIKDADGSKRLEGHLNSDDFFGTTKFPTSTFAIVKVYGSGADLKIMGDLTIKGIKNSITFPATVALNKDGSVSALAGKIMVDRSKYDVRYGSKSFFNDIGDKAIDDMFEIGVNLVATK